MLIQSEIVNGSSINKTWELKSGARVMNITGENEYNFAYSTPWLRSKVIQHSYGGIIYETRVTTKTMNIIS